MIFYFTGTGNSGHIATQLAKMNQDKTINVAQIIDKVEELEFVLKEEESIGFVYPIYAWGPPSIMLEFMKKVKFKNYQDNYVFSVATCGASIGNTMELVRKIFNDKALNLDSGFSIIMPNSCITLGDVDAKVSAEEKLKNANRQLEEINKVVQQKKKQVFKVNKGPMPNLMTNRINPLFNRFAINSVKFNVSTKCIGCGKCKKVCNRQIIELIEGKPTWKGQCCGCLACINYCPTRAIEYGKATLKKGRYTNPYYVQ